MNGFSEIIFFIKKIHQMFLTNTLIDMQYQLCSRFLLLIMSERVIIHTASEYRYGIPTLTNRCHTQARNENKILRKSLPNLFFFF